MTDIVNIRFLKGVTRKIIMNMTKGFDNELYLKLQSEHIKKRIEMFDNKLYLELGGKLFDDYHASRVLPGFEPDSKAKMFSNLADSAEIVIVINAVDIEKSKIRGDHGMTYDEDVLRLIDGFRDMGLYVGSVVISQYSEQYNAEIFKRRLESLHVPVYLHYTIPDYPANLKLIVSEEGYGRNQYIETTRPLVIVTAPGPGSGKMSTCLSQLYHEHKRGVRAGYAKFETFPIWNLPLKHPLNLAYEAATADLMDVNMIDPFHLETYGQIAVNYNRDVNAFPLLNAMFERIIGESPYLSPTDMGVNMVGFCITDEEIVNKAAKDEIIRRYYAAMCDRMLCTIGDDSVYKIELIMNQAGISIADRQTVAAALNRAADTSAPAFAIELDNGEIVTGRTTPLLGASSAALINVLKKLAEIDDNTLLLSKEVIEPVQVLKTTHLGNQNPRLHTDETLIALAVCAANDPLAELALRQLPKLKGFEAHSSVMLSSVDVNMAKKLGLNLTCEPVYETKKLKH